MTYTGSSTNGALSTHAAWPVMAQSLLELSVSKDPYKISAELHNYTKN